MTTCSSSVVDVVPLVDEGAGHFVTAKKIRQIPFHWRQFLPIKSWRPRLPFEKYQHFIKMQAEMSRELQRSCYSHSLKLQGHEKDFVLQLREYAHDLEKAFLGIEGLREQREFRDVGDEFG